MKNFDLNEFQSFVKERDHWPNHKTEVMLKFVEEVGELANEVRKASMEGLSEKRLDNIKLELYDCLHYVAQLANIFDIDLNEAIEKKEKINKERYNR
jgi:NTP pyrophosphatase (non-canonical NTP hydrolase)